MQAMIITAFNDYKALEQLVRALSAFTLCFVHVDAGGSITAGQTQALNALQNVRAIRKYRMSWGGRGQLCAILDLCRMAVKDERVTYLHLMDDETFPVISAREFTAHFEREDRLFMQRLRTADDPEMANRYAHYHLFAGGRTADAAAWRAGWGGRLDRLQERLHVRRKLCVPYSGLAFLSLPRAAVCHALNGERNRAFMKKLRTVCAPEEFFFQNAFTGSPFEKKMVDRQLTFSVWDEPRRGLPAVLCEKDLAAIDASGCAFARKVRPGTGLFKTLCTRWAG